MLASLLLTLLALASSFVPSHGLFRFSVQTANAAWPVRIQPAWQSVELGMDVAVVLPDGQPGVRRFPPGSMILYAGIGSNDVWITRPGTTVGASWTLVSGIVRDPYTRLGNNTGEFLEIARAPYPWDEASFYPRFIPAVCEDPNSDRSYIVSGVDVTSNNYLYGVWRTDDGRTWQSLGRAGEYEPRAWSSCVVGYDASIVLTGGLGAPYTVRYDVVQDALNDVWRSHDYGTSWQRVTEAAPWAARFETLTFATRMPVAPAQDILYVIGGATPAFVSTAQDVYYNDVWASSDYGVSWALVCGAAPWAGRWGHSGVVTRDGALVFYGGAVRDDLYERPYNFAFYGDIWASLDGGVTWHECTARTVPYNRTEAAVALSSDGHLLMAAGYSIHEPRPAQADPQLDWHNDVVRSVFSLEQAADGSYDGGRQLAEACGATYPASGVIGLQQWPAARWDSSKGAVAGIVATLAAVTVCVACYMYTRNSVQQHGAFRWPSRQDITHKLVQATQMPDVRFITDLPIAQQYRDVTAGERQDTAEGQQSGGGGGGGAGGSGSGGSGSGGGNNLSESLLGEGQQRSEGSAV